MQRLQWSPATPFRDEKDFDEQSRGKGREIS